MSKRPMVIITISYIIGIIMGLYLKINTALFVLFCLVVIYVIFLIKLKYLHPHAKLNKIIYLVAIIIVFISCSIVLLKENRFKTLYFESDELQLFQGVVIDVAEKGQYYDNYIVRVQSVNNDLKYNNTNIILKVKNKPNSCFKNLEYGDLIYGYASFEKPEVRRNYKGFDYSQYLKTQNVYRVCKSDYNSIDLKKKNCLFVGKMWITNLRNRLINNINQLLDKSSASVANSILFGDSSFLDDTQRQYFNDASLIHILAISGMHVTYVAMFWTFSLKKFDNRKRKYFIILFLVFIANLTGCSPSVIRASIMCSVAIFSKLVYRKSDTISNIALSGLIILIINPYNLLNLGFQLSFLGTLGIVLFNSKISSFLDILPNTKIIDTIKSIIVMGISANILIIPILIYTYNTFSLIFLISTILVTPILLIMIFTGYLTAVLSLLSIKLAGISAIIFDFLVKIFNHIAELCSKITFLRFTVVTPSVIEVLVYYLIIFYLFFFFKKSHIKAILKIMLIIVLITLLMKFIVFQTSGLKLYFIDVGQGDSCLIKTETNKVILIDGGGSETGSYDVGKNVLVPYLLDRKITKIDYMIISHFDSDHVKGLFTVIEKLNVKNAVIAEQGESSDNYRYFEKLVKSKRVNVITVKAGDRLQIDKSTFIDILWPTKDLIQENILNNNSIVCKLNYKDVSILFTGDIEKVAEDKIIQLYGNRASSLLKSTVLKVAHHGSKSSSIQDFVECVQPKIALIGVGKNNKFGHPNEDVVERIERARREGL